MNIILKTFKTMKRPGKLTADQTSPFMTLRGCRIGSVELQIQPTSQKTRVEQNAMTMAENSSFPGCVTSFAPA